MLYFFSFSVKLYRHPNIYYRAKHINSKKACVCRLFLSKYQRFKCNNLYYKYYFNNIIAIIIMLLDT